jgi:hypothetical protein
MEIIYLNMEGDSKLLKKIFFGIQVTPFDVEPLYKFTNNWLVFDAGKSTTLPPEERNNNENFQIQRDKKEKILVRVYLSSGVIVRVKYYYIKRHTDCELSYLLTKGLISRLRDRFPAKEDYEMIRYAF